MAKHNIEKIESAAKKLAGVLAVIVGTGITLLLSHGEKDGTVDEPNGSRNNVGKK